MQVYFWISVEIHSKIIVGKKKMLPHIPAALSSGAKAFYCFVLFALDVDAIRIWI